MQSSITEFAGSPTGIILIIGFCLIGIFLIYSFIKGMIRLGINLTLISISSFIALWCYFQATPLLKNYLEELPEKTNLICAIACGLVTFFISKKVINTLF